MDSEARRTLRDYILGHSVGFSVWVFRCRHCEHLFVSERNEAAITGRVFFSATVDSCMEVRFSQFLNMTFLETFLTKLWTAGAEDR